MAKFFKSKRQLSPAESYTTNRKQLYILPTRIGFIFALLILALLVAAIRFNHQATYLLTFILAAIGQVTSLYTHKNLLGLNLSSRTHTNVFCKEDAVFNVTINNPTESARHAVWLICNDHKTTFELAAKRHKSIAVSLATKKRGNFSLPPVILSSQYPIGILFSWTRSFISTANCVVYPEPKQILPFPEQVANDFSNDQTSSISRKGSDELSHTRPYQTGDRPRDIHWQAYAKHQQLVSRELVTDSFPSTEFNWQQVNKLSIEDKLSQLCAWIVEAEEKKIDYILRIPSYCSDNSHGEQHKHKCLRALALFDQEHSQQPSSQQTEDLTSSTNHSSLNMSREQV